MSVLSKGNRLLLLSLGSCLIPSLSDVDDGARDRVFAVIEATLAARPPRMHRQVSIFLAIVSWLLVVRFGRPFRKLNSEAQMRFLRWLQDCPITVLRQGFWALKTLVYMGYYGQPSLWDGFQYHPSFDGNQNLHA